ncbi:MAG: hypothetical protein NTZ40_08660 [Cyanobacteria bacterium]|nr:hypothetical protein [Cyanobacteriota bacterium]
MSVLSAPKLLAGPAARTPCADLGCSNVDQALLCCLKVPEQEAAIHCTGNSFDSVGDPQRLP